MKWLVSACFLVCLAKFNEGGVFQNHEARENVFEKNTTKEKEAFPVQMMPEEGSREMEDVECLSGTEWQSHCHFCKCSASGIAECLKQDACDIDAVIEPIRCKPNTTFLRDCNTCVCLENGLGLCTLDYCRRSNLPKKSDLMAGKDCAPGTHWKSQCNDCGCSPEGYAFCTEKACLDHEKEPTLRCAPDSIWKNECNTCWCTSDGQALCTKIGCVSDAEFADTKLKEEADNIKTKRTQLETKSVNDTKQIVCQANRMFIKDCNTCWCNDDGTSFFCTRKICVTDLPDETDTDRDKLEDLSLSRSRRSIPSQTPPKTCQPRAEFRLDCNQCLCDSDGKEFSCTRFDCSKKTNGGVRRKRGLTKEVEMKCVPESVFDQDCNVCRCTKDGNHATCSLKRCNANKNEKLSENEVDNTVGGDSSFRCNPGEQFKRICNDCTCSADGRSIFCTLRLCDEDITPSE